MSLLDYGRVIIRRGWIIILAILITASAAYIYSRTQTVEYKATQKVSIIASRNDFGLVETLRNVMRNYVEYLYTDLRAAEVIERLELDMTPSELRQNITINSDPTTQIIQIDAEMKDGETAAAVANTWGQLLVEFRNQRNSDLRREDRIEAELLDYPTFGQSKPNTRTNVLAAAVLGVLLGGIVIFALEFLEANILHTPEELERWLDKPILATIPAETKGDL
jgi:capsular polysaccharide biosynthesis protein